MSTVATPADELGLSLDPSAQEFLLEWRAWLDDHLAAAGPQPKAPRERLAWLRAWQASLDRDRFVAIGWPREHGGRDAGFVEQFIYHQEAARRRAPGPVGRIGLTLCGPTLIAHGTTQQQERFLPAMRSGEHIWCQGFSEPGAGSDLAGLRTRGVVDGDQLVISGQKVWTSGAQYADWMFALVRTDPQAPKHQGISFVLVPMDHPGVTVSPIKQISGASEFNEVFLDEVRVPLDNVVGGLGQGWKVTRTTLSNERAVLFVSRQIAASRLMTDIVRLALAASGNGEVSAHTRERIARAWISSQLIRVNGQRNLVSVLAGSEPGPEGAMSKLYGQETEKRLHELAMDVAGPAGLLERGAPGAVDGGKWNFGWLKTRASTIGGGTSEIQRNILAERVLGQPRDPWAD
jgi:alkylation response protein AidB-like acyl-CoA dehydrogenase